MFICIDCTIIEHTGGHVDPAAERAYREGMEELDLPTGRFLNIDTYTNDGEPTFMDYVRCIVCRNDQAGDFFPCIII